MRCDRIREVASGTEDQALLPAAAVGVAVGSTVKAGKTISGIVPLRRRSTGAHLRARGMRNTGRDEGPARAERRRHAQRKLFGGGVMERHLFICPPASLAIFLNLLQANLL